jgi:hypothetical protein
MVMTVKPAKNSGWAVTELIVSIGILGMIMGGLYTSMNTCRMFNKYQLLRQRCVAAAQAQLESIAATGEKISDKDNERLWPDVEISVERKDGSGDWQGLRLVTVTARNVRLKKTVSIELSRYLPVEQEVN